MSTNINTIPATVPAHQSVTDVAVQVQVQKLAMEAQRAAADVLSKTLEQMGKGRAFVGEA